MICHFSICNTEDAREKYIQFLLQHYEELNQPYSFPVTLSYISSPLLMEGTAILCTTVDGETIGALGYIQGTGEHDYEDVHIVQLQTVFLLKPFRGSRLFLRAIQFLAGHLAEQRLQPSEIRFWVPNEPSLLKLCSRFSKPFTGNDDLTEFRVPFARLQAFSLPFSQSNDYALSGGQS